jgi:uncharacterized protein YqhQ
MKWPWSRNSDRITSDKQLDGAEKTEKTWGAYLRIGVLAILLIAFGIVVLAITLYFVKELFTNTQFANDVMKKVVDALPNIATVVLLMFGFKGIINNK